MKTTILDEYLKDAEFRRLFAQEDLIMEVTETLCELMEKEGISRKELADRLGKSKGFISQLLNGGRNLTLRTVADILHVLGYKVYLTHFKEAGQQEQYDIIRSQPWHTQIKGSGLRWQTGEVSIPENYFFDKTASSR